MAARTLEIAQGECLALAQYDVYGKKMEKPVLPAEIDMEGVVAFERAQEDFVDECVRMDSDLRVAAEAAQSPSVVLFYAAGLGATDLLDCLVCWIKKERNVDMDDYFRKPFDLDAAFTQLKLNTVEVPKELENTLPDWTHACDIRPAVLLLWIGQRIANQLDKKVLGVVLSFIAKKNVRERMRNAPLIWPQIRDLAQREIDSFPSDFWNLKTDRDDDDEEDLRETKEPRPLEP